MEDKDIRKITDKITDEVKRHIDVLKEDFDSKVQLIAEQYASIREALDFHTKTLDSHTKILDSHTGMIVSMKEDIEIMKVDVQFIKGSLKKKVDMEEFETLARRVAILEAKLSR